MRGRRSMVVLVLVALVAIWPASAFAQAPLNDTQAGAQPLKVAFSPSSYPVTIFPTATDGGWTDATASDDADAAPPSCLGAAGFHSMWYSLDVPEASVLTVSLRSTGVDRYQPVVTIISALNNAELACGLGGADFKTDPGALASTYVPTGKYFVRVASVGNSVTASNIELPTVTLTESLRDVTPPQIQVSISGKAKIVGIGKPYTFDATGSTDNGSLIDPLTAVWTFYDRGTPEQVSAAQLKTPLRVSHTWTTPGLHLVTLQLSDRNGNTNTYRFTVLVHNFVPPKVSLLVYIPSPGAHQLKVRLTHDVPVRVRLVIMQNGRVLRAIPSRFLAGTRARTTLKIALKRAVGSVGFVVVSGVASDVGQFPNTVPLLTCSVDPVRGAADSVCA